MKVCVPSMCASDDGGIDEDDVLDPPSVSPSSLESVQMLIDAAPEKNNAGSRSGQPPSSQQHQSFGDGDSEAQSSTSLDSGAPATAEDNANDSGEQELPEGAKIEQPRQFFALRWASVVADNADELLWSYAATPILSLSE